MNCHVERKIIWLPGVFSESLKILYFTVTAHKGKKAVLGSCVR